MKDILIRADGGVDIGMGHFMRGLALCQILKDDFDITFCCLTPDPWQKKLILANCDKFHILLSRESHLIEFLDLASAFRIVVLDNYYFTSAYEKSIKEMGCRLVCIDDIHNRHFHADVVINHSPAALANQYSTEPFTKLFLGLKYAILRPEFFEDRKKSSSYESKKTVCLILGGADPAQLSLRFTEYILQAKGCYHLKVVTNDYHYHSFKKGLSIYGNRLSLVKNLSTHQIIGVLQSSYCGVLPSSTISLEAISLGKPFITGYFTDNQIELYHGLVNNNMCLGIGNLNGCSNTVLWDALKVLQNRNIYDNIQSSQNNHFDGLAPKRLKEIFLSL